MYFVSIAPSQSWLNDESRVYPVVIDPDVSTDSDRMNILDNYVMEGYGVQNNNLDRLYIGTKSGYLCRGFIQFKTMPTIPEGSTITAATMTLDILDGTAVARNASVYMVEEAWVSGELQWSNQPDATVPVAENISHNEQTKYVFSCVDAVRHWYEGDSTGMNENYGIMVRYYDETLINYNSIYSADCSYESKRPVIAITYEPPTDEVSVLEGNTKALSVTGATGAITWTSSNTAAATVDANGVVTGIKAGVTTITASVGDTVYQTFTVYVKIANGVYYIKNGDSLCLGTTGRVDENTGVSLYTKSSETQQLNLLWKITYLESGYYSIRPMYRLSMGLHATSVSADITSISTTDDLSEIPLVNCWGIEYGSDGYVFTHVGTSSMALYASAPNPGVSVTTGIYSESVSGFSWNLERKTDVDEQIVLISTSNGAILTDIVRYISTKSATTLDDHGFTVSFVSTISNEQSFTWTTADTSIISLDSATGTVTGLQAGERAQIIVQVANPYISGRHTATYEVIAPLTMLYSITNSGHNHLGAVQDVYNMLNEQDQADTTVRMGWINADDCKTDLGACTIFTSRSHGIVKRDANTNPVATGIILDDALDATGATFYSNSFADINTSSAAIETDDRFDDLGLALFIACETACGGEGGNNLPSVIVEHGAKVAIGFKYTIDCDIANKWTKEFYKSFLSGETVQEAVIEASIVHVEGDGLDSCVIVGDGSLTINDLRP